MKVVIEGSENEIAALICDLSRRQNLQLIVTDPEAEIERTIQEFLDDEG